MWITDEWNILAIWEIETLICIHTCPMVINVKGILLIWRRGSFASFSIFSEIVADKSIFWIGCLGSALIILKTYGSQLIL